MSQSTEPKVQLTTSQLEADIDQKLIEDAVQKIVSAPQTERGILAALGGIITKSVTGTLAQDLGLASVAQAAAITALTATVPGFAVLRAVLGKASPIAGVVLSSGGPMTVAAIGLVAATMMTFNPLAHFGIPPLAATAIVVFAAQVLVKVVREIYNNPDVQKYASNVKKSLSTMFRALGRVFKDIAPAIADRFRNLGNKLSIEAAKAAEAARHAGSIIVSRVKRAGSDELDQKHGAHVAKLATIRGERGAALEVLAGEAEVRAARRSELLSSAGKALEVVTGRKWQTKEERREASANVSPSVVAGKTARLV